MDTCRMPPGADGAIRESVAAARLAAHREEPATDPWIGESSVRHCTHANGGLPCTSASARRLILAGVSSLMRAKSPGRWRLKLRRPHSPSHRCAARCACRGTGAACAAWISHAGPHASGLGPWRWRTAGRAGGGSWAMLHRKARASNNVKATVPATYAAMGR
eukprot:scaffold20742_cov125-Isochrysis_galbana.AAC.2